MNDKKMIMEVHFGSRFDYQDINLSCAECPTMLNLELGNKFIL